MLERFFDEVGGMQLVIHSPYGSRLNRAWGLALRKRFCRKFNFELQAAATEDNIVLSLTTAHSFDLADVPRYLALFPDQLACAENLPGDREIPDHPLIRQTIADCLGDAMDVAGLERLLTRIESGAVRIVTCDLTEPSPLALEVLSARPYAYLDDAPLEERRTQAVMSRRWLAPEDAADLGRLDPEAIARVRSEAWPDAANADELHDALVWLGFLGAEEAQADPRWAEWFAELKRQKRVARLHAPRGRRRRRWSRSCAAASRARARRCRPRWRRRSGSRRRTSPRR